MQTLTLGRMGKASIVMALQGIQGPHDVIVDDDSAFFLGSVSLRSADELEKFLNLARELHLKKMLEYNCLECDLAWGMLVRRKDDNAGYRLFVVTQTNDPWRSGECLFSHVVTDIEVVAKPSPNIGLPCDPKKAFSLRKVLRAMFSWKW